MCYLICAVFAPASGRIFSFCQNRLQSIWLCRPQKNWKSSIASFLMLQLGFNYGLKSAAERSIMGLTGWNLLTIYWIAFNRVINGFCWVRQDFQRFELLLCNNIFVWFLRVIVLNAMISGINVVIDSFTLRWKWTTTGYWYVALWSSSLVSADSIRTRDDWLVGVWRSTRLGYCFA